MQYKVSAEAGNAVTSHLVCQLLSGCSQSHRSLATRRLADFIVLVQHLIELIILHTFRESSDMCYPDGIVHVQPCNRCVSETLLAYSR